MEFIFLGLIAAAAIVIALIIVFNKRSQKNYIIVMPEERKELLRYNVSYYTRLNEQGKLLFEQKIEDFISRYKITGVDTVANDTDRILIAASAIIPVFAYPDWEYTVLEEVLVYPDNFNENFLTTGPDRYFRGLVGFGHLDGKMLISRTALYEGFDDFSDKRNTCLHEFIHLIDKEDGNIDGIPSKIIENKYAIPWLFLMKREISRIGEGNSDIHPYATKNTGEFLSVVSEYFFERPDDFQAEHPELFNTLKTIFRQPLNKY